MLFFAYLCSVILKKNWMINRRIMKKIGPVTCFVAASALLLTTSGCGRASSTDIDSDSSTAVSEQVMSDSLKLEMQVNMERGAVLERVRSIYRLVKSEYMVHGGAYDSDLFDKAFCSKSWNRMLMDVRRKEYQTGTLFFEVNPWSMARYSGVMVSFDEFDVDVIDILGDKKRASVTFTVYEDNTYTPARIDLICENGCWMIDNFYNLKYGLDVKNCMWEYLAHDII